jgi:hypothetical protein
MLGLCLVSWLILCAWWRLVWLQVRHGLVSSSLGKSGTPHGTPKAFGKSPLESPLVRDAANLKALNLEPGVTKVRNGCSA